MNDSNSNTGEQVILCLGGNGRSKNEDETSLRTALRRELADDDLQLQITATFAALCEALQ